jgi:hypothetical protein
MSRKTKKEKALRPLNAYTVKIIKNGTRFKDSRGRLYARCPDTSTIVRIY